MADELKRVGLVFKADGTVDFNKSLKEVNASIKENYSAFKLAKSQWDENTKASQKLKDEQKYLSAEVKDYTDKIKMLQGELEELNEKEAKNEEKIKKKKERLDAAKNTAENYKQKCSSLKTELEQLEQEENANEEAIRKKKEELEKAEKGFLNYSDRAEKLEDDIEKLNKGEANNEAAIQKKKAQLENTQTTLNNYRKSLDEVNKKLESEMADLEEYGKKIQESGEKISEAGEKIEKAGGNLTKKLTVPIAGVAAAAVKTAADFDSSMSNVQAISSASADDMEKLRDKAREMGEKTKFSATEAGDAMSYMAMAGWKTGDMLDGVEGIMNLAAASGEDLASTSDIVTDALTAFGMGAEESGKLADIMAAASKNANTNVSMLGESFKYVAPVAGAMGYEAEDVAVALGLMANNGIKASQGGTALRTLLTNMAKPTETMSKAMDVLGVKLDDGNGKMLPFAEVMKQLRNGFGDIMIPQEEFNSQLAELDQKLEDGTLTENKYNKALKELMGRAYGAEGAEKALYAASLAGKEGMSGLLAIVNSSDEDFEKLTNAIYNSEGASEEMANIMQDNLGGQMTILKSQLEELAISVGETLMPTIRDIVSHVQDFVDKLNNMDEGQKQTIITIALLVAAAGPLIAVLGKVVTGIGGITKGVGVVSTAIAEHGSSIKTVLSGIGAGAKALFGIVMAHPVIAIITAIIAAVILLYNKCEWFRDAVNAVISAVIGFFKNFGENIANLKESVSQKFEEIKTAISSKIQAAREKVSEAAGKIKGFLDFGEMKKNILGKFDEIKNGIKNKIEFARDKIEGAIDKIKGFFNFEFHWPNIPLPHFSINPSGWKIGDLLKGDIPSLGISWYKKGGIMTGPTVFGMSGNNLLAGGEAGEEAVLPIELLKKYIREENRVNNHSLVTAFVEALKGTDLIPEVNLYLGDKKLTDLFYNVVMKKISSKQMSKRRAEGV